MRKLFDKINWTIVFMLVVLIASRILFYSLVSVSLFSIGFMFDVLIDAGIVFLLSFIFKKPRGLKISCSIMLIGYIVVFIADYMYFKSGINKIASITALYSAGFVDMGEYGIKIDFNVIMFVLFGLAFLLFIIFYKKKEYTENTIKRKKVFLLLSLILLVPYLYTLSIASKKHNDYIAYLQSDTKIFHDLDKSYYQFMEHFGYSVFRYEDTMRSFEVIIQTLTEAE